MLYMGEGGDGAGRSRGVVCFFWREGEVLSRVMMTCRWEEIKGAVVVNAQLHKHTQGKVT